MKLFYKEIAFFYGNVRPNPRADTNRIHTYYEMMAHKTV